VRVLAWFLTLTGVTMAVFFFWGVVASSSCRWSSMASFGFPRDSSIVFPWLAVSRSGRTLRIGFCWVEFCCGV